MGKKGHKGSSREKSGAYAKSSSKSNSMDKQFEVSGLGQGDSNYEEETDEDEIQELMAVKELSAKIFVWEFGQNDPKRCCLSFLSFPFHSFPFLSFPFLFDSFDFIVIVEVKCVDLVWRSV
jgi:hypothetical protein